MNNKLFYGDNLEILRRHIESESMDLIYLDPPFNSNTDYRVLLSERNDTQARSPAVAFKDTWQWNSCAAGAYQSTIERGGRIAETMHALRGLLGECGMMAYLSMLAPRFVELKRILKKSGSMYLHCDPTASHYLKILLDGVFGPTNFRNEIVWKRTSGHYSAKRWGPVHDILLFYTKSNQFTWNSTYQPYDESYLNSEYKYEDEIGVYGVGDLTGSGIRKGDSGKPWRNYDPTQKNRHWAIPSIVIELLKEFVPNKDIEQLKPQEKLDLLDKLGLIHWPSKEDNPVPRYKKYLDRSKGVPLQDVITDIRPISSHAAERLGYPTQKPAALLERIIRAGSNENDVVLDPFCGCGTAIEVAHRLGRRWIGIDNTHLAITMVKNRLRRAFAEPMVYDTIGEPVALMAGERFSG